MRVLVTEQLAERGLQQLRDAGHEVDVRLGLEPSALLGAVKGAHALVIRSSTKVTAEVLEAGNSLVVVGRAGVGVDNVDVDAATRVGVMVVNAPQSNILSTAEHTMGMLLAQARNIPQADAALKSGVWQRARWEGVELHGKTLGIVGLGRIGSLVAQRASSFGMRVIAWDNFVTADRARRIGVELVELDVLARQSDFVTIHLVKRPEYLGIVGKEFFADCKPGLRVVNCARGGLVDEDALAEAIRAGRVGGAALDVFDDEPKEGQTKQSPLFELDSVVVTPHLSASTTEAQDKAGETVAEQVILALAGDFVPFAINVDAGEASGTVRPFLGLAERLGALFASLSGGLPTHLEVQYQGELADEDTRILDLCVLRGLLSTGAETTVSYVNAPQLAAERGVELQTSRVSAAHDYVNLVTVRGGDHEVAGTLTGAKAEPRIVLMDGYAIESPVAEHMLVIRNDDRPGMIGFVGTTLGGAGVNISDFRLGRAADGGSALAAISTDGEVGDAVLDELRAAPGILSVHQLSL